MTDTKPSTGPLDAIKIAKDSIHVFGGYENAANGYYKETSLTEVSITLFNHSIEYLFEHQLSCYFIVKSRLKSHQNEIYWVILSITNDNESIDAVNLASIEELSDMNMRILYICKDRICDPKNHPPSLNWRTVIHPNVDKNCKAPIILKGEDYFGWRNKKYEDLRSIKCSEFDFRDINIYNVIPLDVETYSTQHSYYKHLSLNGSYHTVVPINGGQRRNRQAAPLNEHQIRWHVRSVRYLKDNDGKDEIEDKNDWIWIKNIAIKHQFKFNCFLGGTRHGNWSIAIRSNKESIPYLEKKYPHFKGRISQWSWREPCMNMIYDEEHMIQIENGIHCAKQIYMEINQVIVSWRKLAIKWAFEENAPDDIGVKIGEYCNIKLMDWYWDEENNSWRSWARKKK
eukprot:394265_1